MHRNRKIERWPISIKNWFSQPYGLSFNIVKRNRGRAKTKNVIPDVIHKVAEIFPITKRPRAERIQTVDKLNCFFLANRMPREQVSR